MIIDFHKDFIKTFKKLPLKVKKKFQERLFLFEKDSFNSILNNHVLNGKYKGYRSINISGDIRAIYRKNLDGVIFIEIGSHSKLYG
jgi:addiction module RelE/StbE family toxin